MRAWAVCLERDTYSS